MQLKCMQQKCGLYKFCSERFIVGDKQLTTHFAKFMLLIPYHPQGVASLTMALRCRNI
jgi:hypothetical protein